MEDTGMVTSKQLQHRVTEEVKAESLPVCLSNTSQEQFEKTQKQ